MKKYLVALYSVLMIFLMSGKVYASNTYYLPDSDSDNRAYHYQKSQHKFDLHPDYWPYHYKKENVALFVLLNGNKGEGLTHKNFQNTYTVPWNKFETDYDLAYCLDDCHDLRMEEFVGTVAYKKVPISESKKVDTKEKKNALIEILRRTYPYVSRNEMVDILLNDDVVIKKEINGKTYINTPGVFQQVDVPKFQSITEDEIMLATQVAIYNTIDPGYVENIYNTTLGRGNNTIVESAGLKFDTYSKGTIKEVQLNIKTISDYLTHLDNSVGTDNEFKIKRVTAKKSNDHYKIYVETNRRIANSDNINVTLTSNQNLGTYSLSKLVDNNLNLYVIDVPKLKEFNSNVKLQISGKYATDEVYVYESDTDEDVPPLIGISSTQKNISETLVIDKGDIVSDSDNKEDNFINDNLYYSPPEGVGSYQKSQHQNVNVRASNGYGNAIIHNLVKTKDNQNLTVSNFSRKYKFPWNKTDNSFVVVYCVDPFVNYASNTEFKRVPINESTFIKKNRLQLTEVLQKSYPYVTRDEMIADLVKNGVIEKKVINGKTYYTSSKNNNPTFEKITESEMILAISDAIYYFVNQSFLKDTYGFTTSREYFNTTMSYTDEVFDTYDVSAKYDEVKNNVQAIYDYLISSTGNNIKQETPFKITNISLEKDNESYYVKIKTNRPLNEGEKFKVSLQADNKEFENVDLAKIASQDKLVYKTKLDKIPNNNDVSVSVDGNYLKDEVYVYEATSGIEKAQSLIGISSVPKNYSKKVSLGKIEGTASSLKNPNTNLDIPYISIIVCLLLLGEIIYIIKRFKKVKSN